jgi:pilus assembly protein CpaE
MKMARTITEALARVVLLTKDEPTTHLFNSFLGSDPVFDLSIVSISSFKDLTNDRANQLHQTNNPLVVVIAQDSSASDALKLGKRIDELRPDATLVWISPDDKIDPHVAMQSGIRRIVNSAELENVLKQTVVDSAAEARKRWESVVANTLVAQKTDTRGSMITVISPKGGVGKTTVSTNIAVGLARKVPNQVILLDLDVQFGDVSSALGLTPTHTLLDIVKGPAKSDLLVLKSFITEHESGLRVIPAPFAPEEASQITAEEVTKLLSTLIQEFEYVIVDTSPGFTELTLAAIEMSNETVVVSELDVPSLRGVRKALDVLIALNLEGNRRKIVVNNMGRIGGLRISDARKLLSEPISAEIPSSTRVMYSTNEGVPLLSKLKRDRATRELQNLVDSLSRNLRPGAYTPNEGAVV